MKICPDESISLRRHPLDAIFAPRSIAVVGATERPGSVGRVLFENLQKHASGRQVFAVNPNRTEVLGVRSYPSVGELPSTIDLAVIATRATTVPALIGQCAAAGVRGAVIVSAGFRECGPGGAELERATLDQARQSRIRLIGPNCLGIMRPTEGLNATFSRVGPGEGRVAFLSQSGALGTAILDWSVRERVGFSAFVSVGSMIDVGWGDLIDYFADDPHTYSILIYMESIGDAKAFLSAAREAALAKPIIVIKPGRTAEGAKAAVSHTGALAGTDEVLDAAFRRVGVLRVDDIEGLFDMAEALSKQPRPLGPHLIIVTNAGGPAVLATDALIQEGGRLTEILPETLRALDHRLGSAWSRANPIDLLGDADADRYARALSAISREETDGLLAILTPQAMTEPRATAERLVAWGRSFHKPVLASWMGAASVADGEDVLSRAGIPTFAYPDRAARVFSGMWRYSHSLNMIYETPQLPNDAAWGLPDRVKVESIISASKLAGLTLLSEAESKQILDAYRIPVTATRIASSEDEAIAASESVGYPVVLKVHSMTISHKRRIGGVQLNLGNADAVRHAYHAIRDAISARAGPQHFRGVTVQPMVRASGIEVVLGSSADPQFGPVLMFGAGGALVEVMRDTSLGLPPLNTTLARRMIERTRIFKALTGAAGHEAVDLDVLDALLVRFSQLVVEQPRIKEVEVNPFLVCKDQLIGVDARIVLHSAATDDAGLPRPAIRPYPAQYVSAWTLSDGTAVTIRPIRPEDEQMMARFHASLSQETLYLRYFNILKPDECVAHERLARMCFIDYDRTITLIAVRDERPSEREIIGVAQLTKTRFPGEAEWAVVVSDAYQGHGLGSELVRRLIQCGRDEKLTRLVAEVLPRNLPMQRICAKLGMRTESASPADSVWIGLDL